MNYRAKKVFNFIKWMPLGLSFVISINLITSWVANRSITVPWWLLISGALVYAAIAYISLEVNKELQPNLIRTISDYLCLAGLVLCIIYLGVLVFR